jgi:hypothetical protein
MFYSTGDDEEEREAFIRALKRGLNNSLWWYSWVSFLFYVEEDELVERMDALTN